LFKTLVIYDKRFCLIFKTAIRTQQNKLVVISISINCKCYFSANFKKSF